MTKKYETIVVFHPDLAEAKTKDEETKIENALKAAGAANIAIDRWGRKPIAYLVRKQKQGNFVCFKYESEKSETVPELTGLLRISETVIKYQTHRISDRARKFQGNPRRKPGDIDEFSDSSDSDY